MREQQIIIIFYNPLKLNDAENGIVTDKMQRKICDRKLHRPFHSRVETIRTCIQNKHLRGHKQPKIISEIMVHLWIINFNMKIDLRTLV